jgi:hypothetical protein
MESLIEECESLGLLENGKMLAYVIYIPKVVREGLALERIKDILNERFYEECLKDWHEDEDKNEEKREDTHGTEVRGNSFRTHGKYHCYYMPWEIGLLK